MSDSDTPTIPTRITMTSIVPALEDTAPTIPSEPRELPPYSETASELYPSFDCGDADSVVSDVFEIEELALSLPKSRRKMVLKFARELAALGRKH